jgi:hypothetical protein
MCEVHGALLSSAGASAAVLDPITVPGVKPRRADRPAPVASQHINESRNVIMLLEPELIEILQRNLQRFLQ